PKSYSSCSITSESAYRRCSAAAYPPSDWQLASRRTVEDHPDGEVLAEILEPVRGSGGDEEAIAGLECLALAVVKQDASAAEDDVDLVLCVGRLLVGRQRPGELYVETTVPQKAYRPLSAGTRDARLSLCEVDYAAVVWFAHTQLLVLPNDRIDRPRRAHASQRSGRTRCVRPARA